MPEQMQVARFMELNKPLETMGKPKPGLREVLVKVDYCGLVPNTNNIVTGKVESLSPKKGRVVVVSSEDEDDMVAWVKKHTDGLGVHTMYDCLGVGGGADTTSKLISGAVKVGGLAILAAGGAEGQIGKSYTEWMMAEVTLVGTTWFTDAEVDEMIALIDAGVIDLSFLEKKEFALKDVNEALKFVGDRPGGATNVVVKL